LPTIAAEAGEHIESALAECTRTEANLGSLLRGLTHLAAGATAAREANTTLLQELDALRELLGQSNEHEMSLRGRVRALEQALETSERDAALARAVLIEQEDLFLAELLTDHEREVARLERRLVEAQASTSGTFPSATLTRALAEAAAQDADPDGVNALDELALDDSELRELDDDEQRDSRVVPISTMPPPPNFEADAEGPISTMPPPPDFDPGLAPSSVSLGRLAQSVADPTFPSSAVDPALPSNAVEPAPAPALETPLLRAREPRRIATLTLRTIVIGPPVETVSTAAAPAETATPEQATPERTMPESITSAVATPLDGAPSSSASPPRHDSRPVLKQKPDPSTRPLVGYSLGSDEIAEEIIDTSRLGPRSPRR
jgi:hypothetical protein